MKSYYGQKNWSWVKFWQRITRFWIFLSYVITTVLFVGQNMFSYTCYKSLVKIIAARNGNGIRRAMFGVVTHKIEANAPSRSPHKTKMFNAQQLPWTKLMCIVHITAQCYHLNDYISQPNAANYCTYCTHAIITRSQLWIADFIPKNWLSVTLAALQPRVMMMRIRYSTFFLFMSDCLKLFWPLSYEFLS